VVVVVVVGWGVYEEKYKKREHTRTRRCNGNHILAREIHTRRIVMFAFRSVEWTHTTVDTNVALKLDHTIMKHLTLGLLDEKTITPFFLYVTHSIP
jgi:hypothetical protein